MSKLTAERKRELKSLLVRMREASTVFYSHAFVIGVHPFIEFTGFMNEYIKICGEALAADIDFAEVSIHHGGKLPMHPHEADYLGEKFGCIFATTFHDNPQLLERFLRAAELAAAKKAGKMPEGEPDGGGK